jgi:enamine deaminase RidA (YjgF/YER057c/UK114 family)
VRGVTLAALAAIIAAPAFAQTYPMKIPTPSGEVIIPNERHRPAYDTYRYAPARRAGDTLYISGVIVGRRPSEGTDVAAFKAQSRRAFDRLKLALESSGLGFADVTMINSFHVWQGPDFAGTKAEQFEAFQQVMDEYMDPPWPAWTAVGTTGLLGDGGIVEIQMIAHDPRKPGR